MPTFGDTAGSLELHILGSGTCALRSTHRTASYVVTVDGEPLALDLGNGAIYRQLEAGFDPRATRYFFITHAHPDHISDLMMLLQSQLYGYFQPNGELDHRTMPLHLIGPADAFRYLDTLLDFWHGSFQPKTFALHRHVLAPGDEFRPPAGEGEVGGPFRVRTARAVHFVPTLAMRFEAHGKSIVFSGDADYGPDLVGLCEGADIALLDCSSPQRTKVKGGHMSAVDCGRVAKEARVKTLVCTHTNPVFAPGELEAEVRAAGFEGRLIVASDGMRISA